MPPANPKRMPQLLLLPSPDWKDYELLDSGSGVKLERYGPYRLVRPEPEAVWLPALGQNAWQDIHAEFIPSPEENGGHWKELRPMPEFWVVTYKDLRFRVQTTASRHVGIFPEQASQWDWIEGQASAVGRPARVLNLFGYTGAASLAATRGGAQVTHVDASKKVIGWARENQELSGLGSASIRWILDDAMKFVQREGRRGSLYDGLILDPPKFGRGPKGEVWEFYKLIPTLLQACRQILTPHPQFVLMTAYAVKASALTLYYALEEMMAGRGGTTSAGEVVLQERSAGRHVSMAVFARWTTGG